MGTWLAACAAFKAALAKKEAHVLAKGKAEIATAKAEGLGYHGKMRAEAKLAKAQARVAA